MHKVLCIVLLAGLLAISGTAFAEPGLLLLGRGTVYNGGTYEFIYHSLTEVVCITVYSSGYETGKMRPSIDCIPITQLSTEGYKKTKELIELQLKNMPKSE